MDERVTPYDEGGSVVERVDEIVASGRDIHIEMTGEETASMRIGPDSYLVRAERGKLVISWVSRDVLADMMEAYTTMPVYAVRDK